MDHTVSLPVGQRGETLSGLIDHAVAQAVDKALQPLSQRSGLGESLLLSGRGPATPAGQVAAPPAKGQGFARIVRALGAAKGIPQLAADFAAKTWGAEGEVIAKTLAAGSGSSGGFLVPENYSAEIIDLLRQRTVVRRAGALVVPMNGSLLMPKLASGAAASYIGENQTISKTSPGFGQLRLTSRKLAAMVPLSNDLLRTASPQADQVVLDDLIAGMSVTEDAAFLRNDGTGNAPKGLRYWADPTQVTLSSGTGAVEIEADLKALVTTLEEASVRMLRPAWFMAPRSRNHLFILRDAVGNLLFPELRITDPQAPFGRLWGYPVFPSNNLPTDGGVGGDESEVMLADMADVLIGEDGQIEISLSDTAAYHDGSSVVAAFSQDQTVVRAIARHDFALRHDQSVAVKTGVTWGA
jgi:HK97 family phage major capsid protein|tara:strand:+ start:836 stop:2068 length:1233 start_codon:yes stop_codon:yes gene_type:complete